MSEGIICDKCKKIIEVTMTNPQIHQLNKDLHLCHRCWIDFKEWLKQ